MAPQFLFTKSNSKKEKPENDVKFKKTRTTTVGADGFISKTFTLKVKQAPKEPDEHYTCWKCRDVFVVDGEVVKYTKDKVEKSGGKYKPRSICDFCKSNNGWKPVECGMYLPPPPLPPVFKTEVAAIFNVEKEEDVSPPSINNLDIWPSLPNKPIDIEKIVLKVPKVPKMPNVKQSWADMCEEDGF